MSQTKNKANAGFTIIEVLIVLAIAGLILLIVFLAVPALQRNSRNTTVKNDAQNVVGGVAEFQGANNGQIPQSVTGTGKIDYKLTTGGNPTSINVQGTTMVNSATTAVPAAGTGDPTPGNVNLYLGQKCDGTSSSRAVAATYMIETATSKVRQCIDS